MTMMNGVAKEGKTPLIKKMLKENESTGEISRKANVTQRYISHIENCLKNNFPTHFHQKKFRYRHPEKRNKERKENYDRGAKYDCSSRMSYSKREDELILQFKRTDRELAKLIGRSVKAIQMRRVRVKKESGFIAENILDSEISPSFQNNVQAMEHN